jgi:hypothetical protein
MGRGLALSTFNRILNNARFQGEYREQLLAAKAGEEKLPKESLCIFKERRLIFGRWDGDGGDKALRVARCPRTARRQLCR